MTGEFYIGYRCKNVSYNRPSDLDFPLYKTSSSLVKPRFEEFDWQIIAEFIDSNSAYDFEQQLIIEHWGNPLLLNKSYRNSAIRFKRSKLSDEQKIKQYLQRCKINGGTYLSADAKEKLIQSRKGKECKKWSEEAKARIAITRTGRKASDETKAKLSLALKGKKRNPFSKEHRAKLANARKGKPLSDECKAKMSASTKGRKRSPEAIAKMIETCKKKREARADINTQKMNDPV